MSTPRMQHIIDNLGKSLAEKLSANLTNKLSQDVNLTSSNAVLKFSLSDPSRNKSATQWLITTYLNDGFRYEDLMGDNTSKVHNTLVNFGLYRGKLPISARSLNRYKTLADVYASIEAFIPRENEDLTLSGKALKRSEREKAHAETEFIHQGEDGFMIVSPKTQLASCWWDRGTQWCTASDNNNMFPLYHEEAPLIILIMPNGDKLQLHAGEDVQFMDARDNEVSNQYIEDNWNVLGSIMFASVKLNGMALECVPYELRDIEICLEAVKQNGDALQYVPWELRDRELYLETVKRDGYALEFVSEEFRDKEICWEAVKQNGLALKDVPAKLRDLKICWLAVKQVCMEAVKQNGGALRWPVEFHDRCPQPIDDLPDWTETYEKLKMELSKKDLRISL